MYAVPRNENELRLLAKREFDSLEEKLSENFDAMNQMNKKALKSEDQDDDWRLRSWSVKISAGKSKRWPENSKGQL